MAHDPGSEAREAAERRVREMQARQTAELLKWQEEERRRDLRAQTQALDENARKEIALTHARGLALERLEREWQQQRDRLGLAPGAAPSFAPGRTAQLNLKSEYERARTRYQESREALEERYAEDLGACRRERAAQLELFGEANRARERGFEEERARKQEDQALGFEVLVHRQMQQAEKSIGEEFARKSRPPERHI
jgi:hypothetical protein